MIAVKGYYDGKSFIPIGDIKIERNKAVIITVLDEFVEDKDKLKIKLDALTSISGILKEEENIKVDEFDKIISKRVDISR